MQAESHCDYKAGDLLNSILLQLSGFPQSCPCCDWRENKFRPDELRKEKAEIPMLFQSTDCKNMGLCMLLTVCYSEFYYYK